MAREANAGGVLFDGTTRMSRNGESVHYYSLVSSHAEYNIAPAQDAAPLRTDFPLDRAALLGCAVMTGCTGRIEPETSAIVVGCGAVGLIAVQGAQLCGASIIVSVDINPLKLESARRVGATHVVDASEDDPVELMRELTGGLAPRRPRGDTRQDALRRGGRLPVQHHNRRARDRARLLRHATRASIFRGWPSFTWTVGSTSTR